VPRRSTQLKSSQRFEQVGARRAARRDATARSDKVPGREALVVGQRLEERRRGGVRERQEGEPAISVGGNDGTRREAAEPSAAVVEHDRPDEGGHELILPGGWRPRLIRVSHVIEHNRSWALVLLFLLIAVESAGVPLPGETALVASGVLASQGKLDIVAVIVIASVAAIVGDNMGYWIGRKGGRALLERWSLVSRHAKKVLPRAERLFAKHGGKTVFFGRFVAILRFTAAWLAGISHMPWLRFLVFNAAGGILWATLVGLIAYYVGGAAADAIQTYGLYAAGGIIVATAGVVLALRWWERRMLANEE
jgi:membrane protein DedA with SNARE-associated domain